METLSHIVHSEPLFLIGLVALLSFALGGGARRLRLPSLIGYMFMGAMLGPSLVNYFNHETLLKFDFITQIALGFVAFGIGSELSLISLKRLGNGIISIIFAESLGAFFVVTLTLYMLTRNLTISLLFGALAPASAPAGTVAVIHELKARGSLTQALYAVVGFDDGLAILIFGLAAALARVLLLNTLGLEAEGGFLVALKTPVIEILLSLGLGAILGFAFCQVVRFLDHARDMLIVTFGFILIGAGLSEHFHLSLILTDMVIGFVLVNTRRTALVHKVTKPLEEIMPLVFLLFFTLAGAHLEVRLLPQLGWVGVVYIFARSAGLIGGSRLGASMGHVEDKIKKWIGLGILSQAGVAIGLCLVVQQDFARLAERSDVVAALARYRELHGEAAMALVDPNVISAALITTITATCIVFEVIGPILTKVALERSGECNKSV